MSVSFPKLFEPGSMGSLKLKNRIVKAPQGVNLSNPGGIVSDRLLGYYAEVAKGGAGLVIVEYASVDDDASKPDAVQLSAHLDEHIAGLSLLAEAIKANGAKSAIQIAHCGGHKWDGQPPIKSASAIPLEILGELMPYTPQPMTLEEIQGVVKSFGKAAKRAQTAGFDMVEIHNTHYYLLDQFMSPRYNKRTDRYGGSFVNRIRLLLEIVAEVRQQVGPQYPLAVRIGGYDHEEDLKELPTYDEMILLAQSLEKAGVDVIDLSSIGGNYQEARTVNEPQAPMENWRWAPQLIKKSVGIPVIICGAITTPATAEEILATGKADFVSLGRALFADPYWPRKAKEGRPEDIRPCVDCAEGCFYRYPLGLTVGCSVNVAMGREAEYKIERVEHPKKVAVVGGGIAGMEAARVSRLAGNDVTLFEKRKLGGVLHEASAPAFKKNLTPLIAYFVTQMTKLGVTVKNEEATNESLVRGGFDAVIVATGAVPFVPPTPGFDKPLVCNAMEVLEGRKVLGGGKRTVVVGAGLVGIETGIFLASQGHEVTFVELLDEFMAGVPGSEKMKYQMMLSTIPVTLHTSTRIIAVQDDGMLVVNRSGRQIKLEADHVVVAAGLKPNRTLIDSLGTPDFDVYEAGDCIRARQVFSAIHEGHFAAKQVNNSCFVP